MEEWRAVEDSEGYFVSNLGNVKSPRGVLVPRNHTHGYKSISLGRGKQRLIHRLVGKAFCDNPLGKPEIDHIDRDKTNNCSTNLRWVTRGENNENKNSSYIYVEYRVAFKRNGVRTRKTFKTLEEAQEFLSKSL